MTCEPECYGKMFPSLLSVGRRGEARGKVFKYRVEQDVAVRCREIGVDREAWRTCTQCAQQEQCFRLSTGLLLLESCVRG